jgi:hypothetical protein
LKDFVALMAFVVFMVFIAFVVFVDLGLIVPGIEDYLLIEF